MPERGAAGVFAAVFAVNAFCAYPGLAPRDSADLALAALTAGVAHPPGYPFYALLGRFWLAALPFGSPAYKLNLLSAAAGAAACAVLYLFARRRCSRASSLACALTLAWSAPLWKFGGLCEMYSLHALFIALLLLLAEGEEASASSRLSWSALIAGLGLVNHQSLLLLLPGLAWLWRGELRRRGARAALFLLLGLSLYGWLWLRLGSLRAAWLTATRAEYGTFTLFGGLARPLTARGAGELLGELVRGSVAALGFVPLFLAGCGLWDLARKKSAWAAGLAVSLVLFGPVFFLLTRLDLAEWVARTILEPAFTAPVVLVCAAMAFGLAMFESMSRPAAAALACAAALAPLVLNASLAGRRSDFAAEDYLRDLRRELAPGGAVLVGGDTAQFGLKYLETARPREKPLWLTNGREWPDPAWIEQRSPGRHVYAAGLPVEVLRWWGLIGGRWHLQPQALVQEALPEAPTVGRERAAWALSTLRWSPDLESGESYAHDVRLAYAFAHYLSARLEERAGPGAPIEHDRWARLLDPEDYRLEPEPDKINRK